jgi:phosphatidate cytidylyltransferase
LSKNLITRIIVALIFGPLIIYISYLGGYWLMGLILLLAVIGMVEYLSGGKIRFNSLLFWISLMAVVCMIALSVFGYFELLMLTFIGCFVLTGIVMVVKNESPADLFRRQAEFIWGVAYLGLLYPFVYHVRHLADNGGDWLLFLFGTLWLSDTLAMFVGKAFGKRKLAPTVSPNKTVAGFIGGLTGGIIVALILKWWRLPEIPLVELFGAGIIVSLIGQLGDLAESCWKRSVGIKDSSAIIPGHGGVLDRFDSLLFAAPALYVYLRYFVFYQYG